jgi:hypothetical protein
MKIHQCQYRLHAHGNTGHQHCTVEAHRLQHTNVQYKAQQQEINMMPFESMTMKISASGQK